MFAPGPFTVKVYTGGYIEIKGEVLLGEVEVVAEHEVPQCEAEGVARSRTRSP